MHELPESWWRYVPNNGVMRRATTTRYMYAKFSHEPPLAVLASYGGSSEFFWQNWFMFGWSFGMISHTACADGSVVLEYSAVTLEWYLGYFLVHNRFTMGKILWMQPPLAVCLCCKKGMQILCCRDSLKDDPPWLKTMFRMPLVSFCFRDRTIPAD